MRCLAQKTATAIARNPSSVTESAFASPSTIVASDILAHSSAAGSVLTFGAISLQASSYAL
jgi:hypothetical protein